LHFAGSGVELNQSTKKPLNYSANRKEQIMKQQRLKKFLLITVLIVGTGAAMAYSSNSTGVFSLNRISGSNRHQVTNNGILSISGHLIQDKILQGSDGIIGLNLTLQAEETPAANSGETRNVDLVIVLDRSGSMKGRKINDARQAVLKLLSNLTSKDRFALVTYSDGVQIASGLLNVSGINRQRMESAVNGVRVGGGTNLGAGLLAGIDILRSSDRNTNAAKVILISDGLANKGITDAQALSGIAAVAVEKEFAVSTVGVGAEFNEYLMTAIADQGTGSYYYLENPAAFAEVFQKEFHDTRASIVNNLKIQIPLKDGISLADAAGYPITHKNGQAVFHPGSLHSGQTRKLYLTLRVPTNSNRNFELNNIKIVYHHDNQIYETILEDSFTIACVKDQREVFSSIDKTNWSEKVINEDFNRLKQEVAADLKSGKKQNAMKRIKKYHGEQEAVNAVVGSASVAENLDKDLKELKTYVEDTFQGAPEAVRQKQKSNAKALQYDGYRGRRQ
jgi:Ca-activated chloride channel family protein